MKLNILYTFIVATSNFNTKCKSNSNKKQIRVNAASPSSLGSLDCLDKKGQEFVDNQSKVDFRETYYCGAPRGKNGVECGEFLYLSLNDKITSCEIAWNAEDPSPGTWGYVEIFKKSYEELTGKSIIEDIYFENGYFMAECRGSCN